MIKSVIHVDIFPNIRRTKSPSLNVSRLSAVFSQSIEARCKVTNEDVVWAVPSYVAYTRCLTLVFRCLIHSSINFELGQCKKVKRDSVPLSSSSNLIEKSNKATRAPWEILLPNPISAVLWATWINCCTRINGDGVIKIRVLKQCCRVNFALSHSNVQICSKDVHFIHFRYGRT